jgi:tRNA G37 N-methylase Trm5
VVNKTASIASEFRTFPLEVLCGEPSLVVELKEGGATFKFDFGHVYWNSRLQHEHARLADAIAQRAWGPPYADDAGSGGSGLGLRLAVEESGEAASAEEEVSAGAKRAAGAVASNGGNGGGGGPKRAKKPKKGQTGEEQRPGGKSALFDPASGAGLVVADCMAGVGPFAVPLGLRGCAHVHANDLNPHSHHWLVHNLAHNKLGPARATAYNLDARVFVAVLRGRAPRPGALGGPGASAAAPTYMAPVWFDHAILNLPATAIDFLDAFRGFLYTRDPQAAEAYGGRGDSAQDEDAVGAGGDVLCPAGLRVDLDEGSRPLPMIHVHCFEREFEDEPSAEGAKARAVVRAAASLGAALVYPGPLVQVHVVRYVSPQKPMLCISFRLPRQAALLPPLKV